MAKAKRFENGKQNDTQDEQANATQERVRKSVQLWLIAAERELRLAQELVKSDGTDENRARYARARADLDTAFVAAWQLLAWANAAAEA
jgi:tryptophan 2,3-dioxygenase